MRAWLVGLLLLRAVSASAQQTFDHILSIQQGGKEIGREEYSIRPGVRTGSSMITAHARYPGAGQPFEIGAIQERAPDGAIAKFELDVQSPEGNVVILAAGSGTRLIVRSVTKGSEAGRELPGARDLVLLDDRAYSLFLPIAEVATPAGTRVTALYPRGGRRATIVARRESGADGMTVQLSGDVTGTLRVDRSGLLQRLELPAAGIVVTPVGK